MAQIGGPRHYTGAGLGRPRDGWKCPACGNLNATPQEQGCPACGVGTPEEAERVRTTKSATVGEALLQEALCGKADLYTAVAFPGLEPKARLTIARALAFYADSTTPTVQELSRVYIMAWARKILAVMEGVETLPPPLSGDPTNE